MKNVVNTLRGIVVRGGQVVRRHTGKIATGAALLASGAKSMAQGTGTDATVIATQAWTAFGIIAPICISIAAFFVILRISKRVAR